MIPDHDDTGTLPPGEHDATWHEVRTRFGGNPRREYLLAGLRAALIALTAANMVRIYLDGSFVTMKALPGDYDACWDWDEGTDFAQLDPVFMDFSQGRLAQKLRFGGEFFPADAIADGQGTPFRQFFQRDKETGAPKGIIRLSLRGVEGVQAC